MIASQAASFTSSGAEKSGKPCERLIAPYRFDWRVISRMTDSVNCSALWDMICLGIWFLVSGLWFLVRALAGCERSPVRCGLRMNSREQVEALFCIQQSIRHRVPDGVGDSLTPFALLPTY